jgi:Arc/MetJ-type ribon-helix-helix transcriptional regulator
MKKVTIRLPEKYIADLNTLVFNNKYSDRNSAIRDAVRQLLVTEVWNKGGSTQ